MLDKKVIFIILFYFSVQLQGLCALCSVLVFLILCLFLYIYIYIQ